MPAITDLPIWIDNGYEIRTQGTVTTTPATYTYSGNMQSYIFKNDGSQSITLTISGNSVTVASGEMVNGSVFSAFTVSASSGTASWTMRAFELASRNSTGAIITANTQLASAGDTGVASGNVPLNGNYLYNGASWDAWRNIYSVTALASAARTATTNSSDFTNWNARGIVIYLVVSSAGTGGVTLSVQGKDSVSGNYRTITGTITQVTTAGTSGYIIYPGVASAAGYSSAHGVAVPRTFRIVVTHADSSSWTYSVSYDYIL